MSDNLPAINNQTNQTSVAEIVPVSIDNMKVQVQAIQKAMTDIMIKDVHYGIIPGTDKPTLLQPGAEKIGLLFRLAPTFHQEVLERAGGHREVRVTCTLTFPNGTIAGQGVGVCSTLESKYRWRKGEGESTGRSVPKEYWENRDASLLGGKEFDARKVDGQWMICKKGERVENPDIADQYNTVVKMAKKRAHVDAIKTCTAASDCFSQDVEDLVDMQKVQSTEKKPDTIVVTADNLEKKPKYSGGNRREIDWSEYQYRYHLPVKKEGVNMVEVRAWLGKQGFKFNPDDKHWYGNMHVERIAEYLRPLVTDKSHVESMQITLDEDGLPAWQDGYDEANYDEIEVEV